MHFINRSRMSIRRAFVVPKNNIYGKRIMEKSLTNTICDFWSLANFGASLISSFLLL